MDLTLQNMTAIVALEKEIEDVIEVSNASMAEGSNNLRGENLLEQMLNGFC